MNIISYDIEIKQGKKLTKPISEVLTGLIAKHYTYANEPRTTTKEIWMALPHEELKSIISPNYLICSFVIENTQVFLFQNSSPLVSSNYEATITVVALADKEINYIIKSSFLKIKEIFKSKTKVKFIEGTCIKIYPFDSDKNDVINPHFFIKADFDTGGIKLENKDLGRIFIIFLITIVFVILYFISPTDIVDPLTKKSSTNNVKGLYSAVMSFGVSVLLLELISNIILPYFFKIKYPKVLITNFSNMIENNDPKLFDTISKPKDPVTI